MQSDPPIPKRKNVTTMELSILQRKGWLCKPLWKVRNCWTITVQSNSLSGHGSHNILRFFVHKTKGHVVIHDLNNFCVHIIGRNGNASYGNIENFSFSFLIQSFSSELRCFCGKSKWFTDIRVQLMFKDWPKSANGSAFEIMCMPAVADIWPTIKQRWQSCRCRWGEHCGLR